MSGGCGACSDRVSGRYDQNRCETNLRNYVAYRPIAFHCSVFFADILDTSASGAWDTALTNNDILVFPSCGYLELGDPTNQVVGQDACGNDIPGTDTYTWEYTNADADDDFADEDWYYELGKNFSSYRYGFIRECQGEETRLYLNDAAIKAIRAGVGVVPSENPGFSFGVTQRPYWSQVNGKGEAGNWKMAGDLKTNCTLRSTAIPGLSDLLQNY